MNFAIIWHTALFNLTGKCHNQNPVGQDVQDTEFKRKQASFHRYFRIIFHDKNILISISSRCCNWQYVSIESANGMITNRRLQLPDQPDIYISWTMVIISHMQPCNNKRLLQSVP